MIRMPFTRITEELLLRRYPYVETLSDVRKHVDFSESVSCYDVFISHSYSNKPSIARLHQLFADYGFNAFVDWKDEYFDDRSKMDKERADKLREHISRCGCLIYVDTIETEGSFWCPWELGLADAYTGGGCFVMPPLEGNAAHRRHEYLQLYDELHFSDGRGFFTSKGNLQGLLRHRLQRMDEVYL